jgi:hypothetical protein
MARIDGDLITAADGVSPAKGATPTSASDPQSLVTKGSLSELAPTPPKASPTASGTTKVDVIDPDPLVYVKATIDALLADKLDASQKGAAGGVAPLGADSKIPGSFLPALAISDTFVINTEAAQLALTAQVGDVAVRTDLNRSFILRVEPATTLGNWQELLTPTDAVLSVNGQTGVVTISAAGLGAALAGANTDITSLIPNWIDLVEQASIANPAADRARLYAIDVEGITVVEYRSSTGFNTRVLRDQLYVVRNVSGVNLIKGAVVRVNGVTGNGATAAITVTTAQANAAGTMPAFGLLAQDIPNNGYGRCMVVGRIDGLNTSAFAALDMLYVSPTTAGGLTNVRPGSPNRAQPVAQVINSSSTNGAITVFIENVLNEILSTVQNSFSIGDNTAGAKQLRFLNGFTGTVSWNPTANRTQTNPDASGTYLLDTTHGDLSAGVHGLPANVNVLGNRSAAGEFIQRASVNIGATESTAFSIYQAGFGAVTFPVAFTTTPIVLSGGTTSIAHSIGSAYNITTTGFTFARFDITAGRAANNCGWVAFGK